jgi:hypothetical protein
MKADFVEVDTGIAIAEGEAAENVSTDTYMTEEQNPFFEMERTMLQGAYDIALIDTGADGADAAVSVIGEYAGDDNTANAEEHYQVAAYLHPAYKVHYVTV